MKTKLEIKVGEFKEGQLLRVLNVNNTYRINRVTEKAILIECSDGKWLDNGSFVPLWLPISQMTLCGINSNPDNSKYGIHSVDLPEWLINSNSTKW